MCRQAAKNTTSLFGSKRNVSAVLSIPIYFLLSTKTEYDSECFDNLSGFDILEVFNNLFN
jgi:hypothetical protein